MKVYTVRINTCAQVKASTLNNFSFGATPESGVHEFSYLELLTFGWDKGARTRKKNFSTFDQLYAYLKKLNVGGYISADDYCQAWDLVDKLRSSLLDHISFTNDEVVMPSFPLQTKYKTESEWKEVPFSFALMDTLVGTELWSRVSKARYPRSFSVRVEGSKDESAVCEDAQTEDGESSEED